MTEKEKLLELCEDLYMEIKDWICYVDLYSRKKWGYEEDLANFRKRIDEIKNGSGDTQ